jgi:citrate lyase subunit beta/citryl-CoA lyase
MSEARTYLYVPGHRPERFSKAFASGADAVILDLEDAVPIGAKDDARTAVADALGGADRAWVRINAGERGLADLAAIATAPGLSGVIVPKASVDNIGRMRAEAPGIALCALVESAGAIASVAAIAAADGVQRLAIGEVDLTADLRLGADPLPEVLWALRTQVVVAAAASGRPPPIGPVPLEIHDSDGLRRSTRDLRRAGFWSRQIIHPTQVEVVHAVLTPTTEERDRAAELLALADAADGGVFVDANGRMVDEAVLRSARLIIDLSDRAP